MANAYGADFPLPNVNMSSLGFASHGDDTSLPSRAYHEPLSVPSLWPFALHGSRGVKIEGGNGPIDGPDPSFIAMARALRNGKLDPESSFYQTFQLSQKLQRWTHQRNVLQPKLEQADLVTKLQMLTNVQVPLSKYGLASSPDAAMVQAAFPRYDHDPLHAQAALAYLLIKNRVSVSVTIGPNFNLTVGDQNKGEPMILNPPLSFDNSHSGHRVTQAYMWQRMLDVVSSLIRLLKADEFVETGESYWDRTMIYCATDFGRSKKRTAIDQPFGSGHDLNNGVLAISPMLNGGRVLGAVNATDGHTYGFDPQTGAPTVPGDSMSEGQIYAGLVQAMGVDTSESGLPDVPIMRKA